MKNRKQTNSLFYSSIWISDTHLGTKYCQADALIQFLLNTESEKLYLVGDIIDLWAMKKNIYWPQSHSQIIKIIQKKSENGTQVIYIPGNHDSSLHNLNGKKIGDIQVSSFVKHKTSNGESLLVLHGDQVDLLMQAHISKLTYFIGDIAYDFILFLNRYIGTILRSFGIKYWSLSSYIKNNLRNAMKHIATYENLITTLAHKYKVTGVVCGHIHYPRIHKVNNINYYNTGDWVEHGTALVENEQGEIKLINWSDLSSIYIEHSKSDSIAA